MGIHKRASLAILLPLFLDGGLGGLAGRGKKVTIVFVFGHRHPLGENREIIHTNTPIFNLQELPANSSVSDEPSRNKYVVAPYSPGARSIAEGPQKDAIGFIVLHPLPRAFGSIAKNFFVQN